MKKQRVSLVLAIVLATSTINPPVVHAQEHPLYPQLLGALDALDSYANPYVDHKAWIVTLIWSVQEYQLPIETYGVQWEHAWHALIALENGELYTINHYQAPDRAGQCERQRQAKNQIQNVINALNMIMGMYALAALTPGMTAISGRLAAIAGLAGMFSASLQFQLGYAPDCA